jgi:hypothetical protein
MWWIAVARGVGMILGAAVAFIGIFIGVGLSERAQDRLDGRFS